MRNWWLSSLLLLLLAPNLWGAEVEIGDPNTGEHASVEARGTVGALAVEIVDSSGSQITSFGGSGATGLADGVKTVTSAGTDVVLATSTAVKWVAIQAQTDNTGLIAVGATGVDATEATGTGIILYPGDSLTFEIDNLADIFIDSTVSGEGVRFFYGT